VTLKLERKKLPSPLNKSSSDSAAHVALC